MTEESTIGEASVVRAFWLIPIFLLAAGCGTSRWAMDDPDYKAKYSEPYGDDKIPRMAKQAIDARHVGGKGGIYVQASGQTAPFNLGGEIGGFKYTTPCTTFRGGLMGLLSTNANGMFGALDLGARVQTPTRLAPFAGVGTFVGLSDIWDEHDDSYHLPHHHHDDSAVRGIAGVYPELGLHYWLSGRSRLSLSGSYLVTTEGRGDDFWYCGVTMAFLRD